MNFRSYTDYYRTGDFEWTSGLVEQYLDDLYKTVDTEDERNVKYVEKFNEILDDIVSEFSDCGLLMTINPSSKAIKVIFLLENNQLWITYNQETNELSDGKIWISLGDRDLLEITKSEVEIIHKQILIWIFENVGGMT